MAFVVNTTLPPQSCPVTAVLNYHPQFRAPRFVSTNARVEYLSLVVTSMSPLVFMAILPPCLQCKPDNVGRGEKKSDKGPLG